MAFSFHHNNKYIYIYQNESMFKINIYYKLIKPEICLYRFHRTIRYYFRRKCFSLLNKTLDQKDIQNLTLGIAKYINYIKSFEEIKSTLTFESEIV